MWVNNVRMVDYEWPNIEWLKDTWYRLLILDSDFGYWIVIVFVIITSIHVFFIWTERGKKMTAFYDHYFSHIMNVSAKLNEHDLSFDIDSRLGRIIITCVWLKSKEILIWTWLESKSHLTGLVWSQLNTIVATTRS